MSALTRELEFSLDLARRCGVIAVDIQRGGAASLDAREKDDDQGLVTRADMELNRRIVSALSEAFPADAIIAEETAELIQSGNIHRDTRRCWYIDPVDGTKEFASGDDTWAIHIGLCIDGRPVLGVVHEPAQQRLNWGVLDPDTGASIAARFQVGDGSAQALAPTSRGLDALRLVSSKSHSSPRTLEVMATLGIDPADNLRVGSVGVKVSAIARAAAEVYAHPKSGTKLWDSCAPQAVLTAAGGAMTDVTGRPLDYRGASLVNTRGLLATHGPHHAEIVERLAPLTSKWFPGA